MNRRPDRAQPRGDGAYRTTGRRPRWLRTTEDATQPLPIVSALAGTPYRDPVRMSSPKRREARRVLEFCLALAELLLRCGSGTAEAQASVIAAGVALGIPAAEIDFDVTHSAVLVAYAPPEDEPMTVLRVVRRSSRDHSRLIGAHRLVADLVAGRIGRDEAFRRLGALESAPKPWPRWLVTAAWGGLAASAAVRFGGSAATALAAFVASCLVDRVGRVLARRGVAEFFLSGLGAAIATLVAIGLAAAGAPVQPGTVVAGGLVVLLPGLGVVAAMQDGIRGFPVTATGRLFAALLVIVALIAGVSLALQIGDAAGVGLPARSTSVVALPVAVAVGVAATAVGALCAAVAYRLPARLLLPTAVVAAAGSLALTGLSELGVGPVVATAAGAVAIGLGGRLFAVPRLAPAIALVVPAVSPLLPGLTLFEALRQLSTTGGTGVQTGIAGLLEAGGIALAIGAGVVLGDQLADPVEHRRALRRRARAIRSGGP